MGVLTAKYGMDFDDLALEVEGFKIVGKPHQISLWRQFVLWMSPIAVTEYPKLATIDKFL